MDDTLEKQIRQFIIDNFLFGEYNGLTDTESLLDNRIIDSTGVLELVSFLEETFNIMVEDEEIIPENLDSIVNICMYIRRKNGILQND